jgi:hypothetical protein
MNSKRSIVEIPPENNYVFARLLSTSPLRASDCLRKLAIQCGAKCPANLTSTRLRKHIATTSQILNLQECELNLLAGFLGHDLHVHRNFYRLPQYTLQWAKVSKILLAFDSGQIAAYKGKSLDEIDVENEPVDTDDEASNSDIDSQLDCEAPVMQNHRITKHGRGKCPGPANCKRESSHEPMVISGTSDNVNLLMLLDHNV